MDNYITFIIENFRYDSIIEADRALKMHYETTFGIFDHRAQTLKGQRPFSAQAYHAGYDKGGIYAFDYLIDAYIDSGAKDMLDMSFERYCSLSPDLLSRLHEKLAIKRKRKQDEEEQRAKEEERRIHNLLNGGNKNSPGVNARALFQQT